MSQPQDPEVAVFAAALELPAHQRSAFLDQACADNADLRRQVEALLRVHDDAGTFFDQLAPVARPTSIERSIPGSSDNVCLPGVPVEKPGDRIGRYKLLQLIGEGGCGVVYMAEQEEPVHRRVALKIIKLGMDTKSVIARFEAERQALALMDHPNIAKVFDAGAIGAPDSPLSTPNSQLRLGRPYFVMELVKAIPITRYCDENNLSTETRLGLFVQVCQAIQHAHQKGIIHRDIKPSNILVADHDGVPVPKIIDFGIAKATTGQRLTDKTVFTAFEQFIGTPAYMSPEQAMMTSLDIDTRTDIYALGVLLYELLTGQTPFDAKDLMAAGLDAIRRTILEQEPPRPSTVVERASKLRVKRGEAPASQGSSSINSQLKSLSTDLDWIVMKALEKDRARRYETASGLARDIQRHLANEPVVARPPSAGYRLQKAWRRHHTAFAVGILILTVLLAATGISAWQAILARQRLAESETISRFLTEVFQSPDPARDGRTITVAQTLSNATQKVAVELPNQPARRTKLQATLGTTYFALGLYREAIPLQEKVRDYHLATSGPEHPDTLVSMGKLANSYFEAGRWDEALTLREESLRLFRKVKGPEHLDTLRAMDNLASSYSKAGRWDEALKLREQSLRLFRKVSGPEHLDTLLAMGNLAGSYFEAGRRQEALDLREQVLALYRKVSRPEHPDRIRAMANLALSYFEADRREEALKLREQVLTLRGAVLGPNHRETLEAMDTLAQSFDDAGRPDEALKLREQVLALRTEVLNPKHPDTLRAMHNLAISYYEAGRLDEATKLFEGALAQESKVLGPNHHDTLETMSCLSTSYRAAGRRDEALKLREQVLALRSQVLGPKHRDTLDAMNNLANSYSEAGRRDEALKLREQALALRSEVLGPKHPETLQSMNNLAISYYEAGRLDEAIKLFEGALPLESNLLGPNHHDTLLTMNHLARCYDEAGRRDEAFRLRVRVLALRPKTEGLEEPGTLQELNDFAWKLATSDVPENRNWTNAVNFAELAVTATYRTNAGFLDTLAAAYAEAQQFDRAVAVQQEALGLLQTDQEKQDYDSRLKLYQANKSYREKPSP